MSIDADSDIQQFTARIDDARFPCVGAKSAISSDSVEFFRAGDLRAADADLAIVACLQRFAAAMPDDALFVSQLVLFPDTPPLAESGFEQALWQRLQALHDLDARDHAWDASVSSDPGSPRFSLSIGGRGYYVIGLHPGASRAARRFHCAALVFNLHSQFETLRADGRYDKLRSAITERDIAYSGSRNPMLASHGEASEARQYSGRQLDGAWRCPFSARAGAGTDAA
jgi:FPC/CPF motif-containing protein YcgG